MFLVRMKVHNKCLLSCYLSLRFAGAAPFLFCFLGLKLSISLITFNSLEMLPTGNYYDSLRDAKLAIQLQPSYLKAIVRGRFFFNTF